MATVVIKLGGTAALYSKYKVDIASLIFAQRTLIESLGPHTCPLLLIF